MDDIAQLKKQLDDVVSTLRRRLSDAHERKVKAEKELDSTKREIEIASKGLEDFKPLQGYYGALLAMQTVAAQTEAKTERGGNRKVVIEILTKNGSPMTNNEIARVAHAAGTIKSRKGLPGVYATIATVLSRGKNVFVNHNGQWDLRDRRFKPSDPQPMNHLRTTAPLTSGAPMPSHIPPEIARLTKPAQ